MSSSHEYAVAPPHHGQIPRPVGGYHRRPLVADAIELEGKIRPMAEEATIPECPPSAP